MNYLRPKISTAIVRLVVINQLTRIIIIIIVTFECHISRPTGFYIFRKSKSLINIFKFSYKTGPCVIAASNLFR